MHIPKTAGIALYDNLKRQRVLIVGHNLRDKPYRGTEYYLQRPWFRKKYVFCFVRNPWDRAVSAFTYLSQGGNCQGDKDDAAQFVDKYKGDFKSFVKEEFLKGDIFDQIHFKPQYEWIADGKGEIIANFVGKLEHFDQDLQKIAQQTGLQFDPVKQVNTSKRKQDYKTYYDNKTKNIVAAAYAKDIELFGYKFE